MFRRKNNCFVIQFRKLEQLEVKGSESASETVIKNPVRFTLQFRSLIVRIDSLNLLGKKFLSKETNEPYNSYWRDIYSYKNGIVKQVAYRIPFLMQFLFHCSLR